MQNPYDGPNPLDYYPHPFDPKFNAMTEQQIAEHWIKQIDRILSKDERFALKLWKNGIDTLEGIKRVIEERGKVTKNQIQAIQNIKWGKNGHD